MRAIGEMLDMQWIGGLDMFAWRGLAFRESEYWECAARGLQASEGHASYFPDTTSRRLAWGTERRCETRHALRIAPLEAGLLCCLHPCSRGLRPVHASNAAGWSNFIESTSPAV
jgi:hypothetical protein